MSECNGCGAKIDWVRTSKGKNIPVEGDYLEFDDLKKGEVIVTDYGNIYRADGVTKRPSIRGRISHFATCPQGGLFRRKK